MTLRRIGPLALAAVLLAALAATTIPAGAQPPNEQVGTRLDASPITACAATTKKVAHEIELRTVVAWVAPGQRPCAAQPDADRLADCVLNHRDGAGLAPPRQIADCLKQTVPDGVSGAGREGTADGAGRPTGPSGVSCSNQGGNPTLAAGPGTGDWTKWGTAFVGINYFGESLRRLDAANDRYADDIVNDRDPSGAAAEQAAARDLVATTADNVQEVVDEAGKVGDVKDGVESGGEVTKATTGSGAVGQTALELGKAAIGKLSEAFGKLIEASSTSSSDQSTGSTSGDTGSANDSSAGSGTGSPNQNNAGTPAMDAQDPCTAAAWWIWQCNVHGWSSPGCGDIAAKVRSNCDAQVAMPTDDQTTTCQRSDPNVSETTKRKIDNSCSSNRKPEPGGQACSQPQPSSTPQAGAHESPAAAACGTKSLTDAAEKCTSVKADPKSDAGRVLPGQPTPPGVFIPPLPAGTGPGPSGPGPK